MDIFKDYLKEVEKHLLQGNATEHTYRGALENLLPLMAASAQVQSFLITNEPKHRDFGAPDLVATQYSKSGPIIIGYLECKDIGKDLDQEEKSDQMSRYLAAQPNVILTDYLEFRWYLNHNQKFVKKARLGHPSPKGKIQVEPDGAEGVSQILKGFLQQHPAQIVRAKDLSLRLASLTQIIRDIIVHAFDSKDASPTLQSILQAFRQTLIPDLKESEFADMFAQTLVYGLFAAWKFDLNPRDFSKDKARHLIPKTNPFLRDFFDLVTGAKLEEEPFAVIVEEVVQLLRLTDSESVMKDFGWALGKKDPIFHFYETFLAAYDRNERKRRGVYYTPEPVVSYIVRSVDRILKTKFNLPQGLADDTVTSKKKSTAIHKVLILDPACGTGTFLYHVIDLIRTQFQKSKNAGMWESYVRKHLLPRLFGFELMMAPYAIAHLKLGLELAGLDQPDLFQQRWGYEFKPNERINVFLTNTLEEAEQRVQQELYLLQFIATEANAASEIKRDLPIMVVMGNPPYSNFGRMNRGKWIMDLLKDYKKDLHEKKINIDDDFIKFIRFGQHRIEKTGAGILAFITNNTYLDGITHRRMRQCLMETFSDIYILDLHGSSKKKEKSPDGSKDKNVFDIQQGVAIGIFVKEPDKKGSAKVHHAELWGTRESKYKLLHEMDVATTEWKEVEAKEEYFFFVPKDFRKDKEYQSGLGICDLFFEQNTGIQTKRDSLTIQFTQIELKNALRDTISLQDVELKRKYNLPEDGRDWKVAWAKEDVGKVIDDNLLSRILYRPFDWRWTYFTGKTKGFLAYPRRETMINMLQKNLGLITLRINSSGPEFVALATNTIIEKGSLPRGNYSLFPLYIYNNPGKSFGQMGAWLEGEGGSIPNLNPEFVKDLEKRLKLSFIPDSAGDLKKTFGPEDIFHYIYAIFHSPTYRSRYAEFLKIDFPRVPLTSDVKLFRSLSVKGQELVALHLLESQALSKSQPSYNIKGDHLVDKGYPKFNQRKVYINKDQYFEGVPEDVWNFYIGGYQVCEKWLKDRRGRNLDYGDFQHYQKIVVALKETIRLMEEIDGLIPEWPLR